MIAKTNHNAAFDKHSKSHKVEHVKCLFSAPSAHQELSTWLDFMPQISLLLLLSLFCVHVCVCVCVCVFVLFCSTDNS